MAQPTTPAGAGAAVTGAGYALLAAEVTCVMTRFELRSVWSLPWMWRSFRRVRAAAGGVSGLLRTAFLLESPRVCFIVSIWASDAALLEFGTRVDAHVDAARHTFRRTFSRSRQRAEVWSAQWRLEAVSNNLNWQGFDLASALDEGGRQAVEAARLNPVARHGRRA